jgi:hypothetical protein
MPDNNDRDKQFDQAIITMVSDYLGTEIENFNVIVTVTTDTPALWEAAIDVYKYQPIVLVIDNRELTISIMDEDKQITIHQSDNGPPLPRDRYWILELTE